MSRTPHAPYPPEFRADALSSVRESGAIPTDGVAGFEYNPRDLLPFTQTALQIALESPRPLEQLAADLARHFAGRTLRMEQVYREHHIGTPFIDRKYKRALLLLKEAGQKRWGTMADSVVVTFPALAA